jgi:MFS family permease
MVLHNGNFRRLLAALAVSQLGDWLYNVALLGYVFERTHSPTWLGVTTAARVLPVVVLGPVAGILGDRFDRRLVMVLSDVVRVAVMAALAVVVVTGAPVALIPLLAALATAASSPYAPCVAASVPRIVEREQLTSANAWRAAIGPMAVVTGPALGALVLAVSSPAWAFVVNGVTFALSAALTVTLRPREAFRPTGSASVETGVWASLTAGGRELLRRPAAARLVGADLLCSFCYGVQTVALVAVASQLGHATSGYGVLLAAFGLGGLVGAPLAGRAQRFAGRRATVTAALLTLAAAMPLTAVLPSFAGVAVAAVAGGAGSLVVEVFTETTLAEQLDDEVFARAYGFAFPAAIAGIVAGSLVAAPLISAVGLTAALAVTGALVAAYAGWLLVTQPATTPSLSSSQAAISAS